VSRFPRFVSMLALAATSVLLAQAPATAPSNEGKLNLMVGKSLVFDSAARILRVSLANEDVAEAVVVSPQELLVHGKAPGETSLVIWQEGGARRVFDLRVLADPSRLDAVRRELREELQGQDVNIEVSEGTVFLRGTVRDLAGATRAAAIAGTLGKIVNLLNVNVPSAEPQILLKVRFANVDRSVSRELGVNFFRSGTGVTTGRVTTGQFSAPRPLTEGGVTDFSLTDALNLFLFRRDLDLGATIRALQVRRLLQILAEPNRLTMNGKRASFLAGGEFPFPVLQGGAVANAITIQFREFGIRITFTPVITPRGTIRLQVTPEVSSLDFANALTIQGFNIPALSTRRVETEIELENGESFAIAGLLDNRVADSFSKVPGIGDIPVLGKLFQSRALARNETELLVVVTPELVRPMPAGYPIPSVEMPEEFMRQDLVPPRTPGADVTGSVEAPRAVQTVPVEQLMPSDQQKNGAGGGSPAAPYSPSLNQPIQNPGNAPGFGQPAPPPPGATPGTPGNQPQP
jgi:pilus assembly protein CpaC